MLSLVLTLALAPLLGACGEHPAPADIPDAPPRAELVDAVSIQFAAADTWGEPPSADAQKHLTEVLLARLQALGQPGARVEFPVPETLRITVERGAEDRALAATRDDVELRLRIRAPAEIENAERERRADLGEFYTPRTDFAWAPLEIGGEILVYVPEASIIARLEALPTATPADQEAVLAVASELRAMLHRRVFSGADLATATAAHSGEGSSVQLVLRPDRRAAFRTFTAHYETRFLAIMVDGVVVAAPPITTPLDTAVEVRKPGAGFSQAEAASLAERLRRRAHGIHLDRRE